MDFFRKKDLSTECDPAVRFIRCLTAFDLVLLGIGAIIGAGIFVLTGVVAATQAGPAIIFSYILAGFACLFSALSYAELATSIGGCGSAYGYAYVGFGEIIAWILGWDLILEYSITISTVAVGWSSYVKSLLESIKIAIPHSITVAGHPLNFLSLVIIFFISALQMKGVRTSTRFNDVIVFVKLAIILIFIVIASSHVDPKNWHPFMPFGWKGVTEGASLIFFAYIGFDAVSTSAEELINPQRDLPIGILGSLFISTVIYIIVSILLTGMVPYTELNVASPISDALLDIGYKAAAGLISVGAIAGLTTVILVLFYALTRVFYAMARDGLLPAYFAVLNPYTKTPVRIILLCMVWVGTLSTLFSIDTLADLVNIGTLFAFTTVCAGVLYLHYKKPNMRRPFKTPLMPYVPILGILSCSYLMINLPFVTLMRFGVWLVLGMIIYFSFGKKHSLLAKNN